PLDDQRNWYRYHHLFAEFLRQRLLQTQPEIIPELFIRASQWYKSQGMLDEAIEYALLGDDFVGAAQLLDGIAETLLSNAEISQFISWADRLPKKVRTQFPRLCIYYAWSLQFEYQLEAAESMLAQAEAHLADPGELPKSFPASQITGHANAIRAYIAGQRGDFEEAVALSLLAYKVLPDLETRQVDILRGILALHLGTMYNFLGQVENAHHYLEIALPLNQKVGTHYPILACLQFQMNVDFTCGALHRAGANGEKGLHWIDEWSQVEGQKRRPARMLAQLRVEMGKLHYEWNNLDQAARYWRKSGEYFELVGSYHRVSNYFNLVDLHQAMGDVEKALGYLGKVKRMRLPRKFYIPDQPLDPQIVARSLLLSQSQPQLTDLFAESVQWAETCGLKPDDEFRYEQEYEYLTLARVLTAQNKAEQAVPLLDRLISSAEGAGRNGQLITYLSFQAVAHHNLDNTDKALKTLSRALDLGEPQGYLRTFVDLGSPMRDLLRIAAQQRIAPGYIGKLLAAFPTKAVQPAQQEIRELLEPLNEREMSILRYMAGRPSNQEIADELHLSVNTVKWYARNIYSKLGVGNRRAAVIRARELGILQIS
ncbi:LuxR C-terminal-related transcriptional regulator, partial [Chloroflexota bacterium]